MTYSFRVSQSPSRRCHNLQFSALRSEMKMICIWLKGYEISEWNMLPFNFQSWPFLQMYSFMVHIVRAANWRGKVDCRNSETKRVLQIPLSFQRYLTISHMIKRYLLYHWPWLNCPTPKKNTYRCRKTG